MSVLKRKGRQTRQVKISGKGMVADAGRSESVAGHIEVDALAAGPTPDVKSRQCCQGSAQ